MHIYDNNNNLFVKNRNYNMKPIQIDFIVIIDYFNRLLLSTIFIYVNFNFILI